MKSYNYGAIRIDHARLFGSACWTLFDQFSGLADAFLTSFLSRLGRCSDPFGRLACAVFGRFLVKDSCLAGPAASKRIFRKIRFSAEIRPAPASFDHSLTVQQF